MGFLQLSQSFLVAADSDYPCASFQQTFYTGPADT